MIAATALLAYVIRVAAAKYNGHVKTQTSACNRCRRNTKDDDDERPQDVRRRPNGTVTSAASVTVVDLENDARNRTVADDDCDGRETAAPEGGHALPSTVVVVDMENDERETWTPRPLVHDHLQSRQRRLGETAGPSDFAAAMT